MQRNEALKSYAVVALFEPLDIGTTISRAAWPAHVTLASNFTSLAPVEQIISTIQNAGLLAQPLIVQFGSSALFGPNHDVPVLLVQSEQATAVHSRLADRLETLSGFTPEEPAYWRDGYRPHLTLGPSITITEGDSRCANYVAIADVLDSDATVVATFEART